MFVDEEFLFEIKPSSILALDAWIMAFIISFVVTVLGLQALVLIEMMSGISFPIYSIYLFSVFPFGMALWKHLSIRSITYTVSSQRLIVKRGVFSTITDEVELVRIRDFQISQPFSLRILGLGNITVYNADRTTPVIVLLGLKNVNDVRNIIRNAVLNRQTYLGYREYEITQ